MRPRPEEVSETPASSLNPESGRRRGAPRALSGPLRTPEPREETLRKLLLAGHYELWRRDGALNFAGARDPIDRSIFAAYEHLCCNLDASTAALRWRSEMAKAKVALTSCEVELSSVRAKLVEREAELSNFKGLEVSYPRSSLSRRRTNALLTLHRMSALIVKGRWLSLKMPRRSLQSHRPGAHGTSSMAILWCTRKLLGVMSQASYSPSPLAKPARFLRNRLPTRHTSKALRNFSGLTRITSACCLQI